MLHPGQHIHVIGVGGFGMSAIARVLLQQGYTVSGSDLKANDFTGELAALGATIYEGHHAENIAGAEVVVATSAAADENPEIAAALDQGIPVQRRRDILGELMAGKLGIAVAGTHGKTTTTALLAHVLIEAGLDPSYIVGGVMKNTGTNAGVGQGPHFVIEADEYDRMFLGLRPQIAVVTNIEHDHPDCFPALADVVGAFEEFVALLPDDGLLVACADDPQAQRIGATRQAAGEPVSFYGMVRSANPRLPKNSWCAADLEPDAAGGTRFTVRRGKKTFGQARIHLAGAHNVQNALAVIAVADHLGVPFERVAAALETFQGTGRRSEVMGQAGGVTVINDYAHHPTAIRVTLVAHRDRPGVRHLWAVWQPHTYGRMRALADEFTGAFGAADHVLVTDVYSVRETVTPGLDAAGMARNIGTVGPEDVRYTGSLDATAQVLVREVRRGDVVVILSAGDAPRIGDILLKDLAAAEGGMMADRYEMLVQRFGAALKRDEPMARYTVARLGGPADALLVANSVSDLTDAVTLAHRARMPWIILGGGANVLAADAGYRGLVIVNHAKNVRIEEHGHVEVESGVGLATLGRRCMNQGLAGLEWAVNVPGTVGGAVINNAGAHGGDIAQSVRWVEVLSLEDRPHVELWGVSQMHYAYRYSILKGDRGRYVVLGATLVLEPGHDPDLLNAKADEFVAHRKRTQPPGASLGSIFKNPPGDFAGRLIEAAGLKGATAGGVQISPVHANFIVNTGEGTAADYRKLIDLAHDTVRDKFGVELELEIELIGAWA